MRADSGVCARSSAARLPNAQVRQEATNAALSPPRLCLAPFPSISPHNRAVTDSSARYGLDDSSALGVPEARAMRPLAGLPPNALAGRRVLIYRSAPSSMTNGISGAPRAWALRTLPRDKWSSPLMGWGAGDDTLAPAAAGARFETVEAAVAFAERAGWAWEVADAPPAPPPAPIALDSRSPGNQYSYNFLSLEVQAALKRAGPRRGRAIFAHPECVNVAEHVWGKRRGPQSIF